MAGVGVDLFLFLSGLGLTASILKNKLPALQFYKKNLLKLYVPFWLALVSFLALDFYVLKITYSWQFLTKATFGIFTTADLYKDINSPLWYFTLIVFYYLLFPILFSKKRPWLSAFLIYGVTYMVLALNFPALYWVSFFYSRHILAFPLGVFCAWLFYASPKTALVAKNVSGWLNKYFSKAGYYALVLFLILFTGYFAYFYGAQKTANATQLVSIITMLAIVWLFSIKKIEFRLLYLFGIYSYEIYLLHWPILYRYDFIYKYLPGWLATVLYLILFVDLAWLFKKICGLFLDKKTPKT